MLLTDIATFLLDTVFTLFAMALLLRLWMQLTRLPTRNPVSQGVFQVTDWIVRPLRRIIPGFAGIDWATVLACWLTGVAFLFAVLALTGGNPLNHVPVILIVAIFTTLKWGVSLVMWVTLLMAILSWVNPNSPITPVIQHLTDPLLRPIRRVIPNLGGFDISPLVLFLIAQILLMVLSRLGADVFGARMAL